MDKDLLQTLAQNPELRKQWNNIIVKNTNLNDLGCYLVTDKNEIKGKVSSNGKIEPIKCKLR